VEDEVRGILAGLAQHKGGWAELMSPVVRPALIAAAAQSGIKHITALALK